MPGKLQLLSLTALLGASGCCLSTIEGGTNATNGSGNTSAGTGTGSATGLPPGTGSGSSAAGSSTGFESSPTSSGNSSGGSSTGGSSSGGSSTGGSSTGVAGTIDVGQPCADGGGCQPDLECSTFTGTCTIPTGSPERKCSGSGLGDPDCTPTVDGGSVGCNGTICCNSFQSSDGPALAACATDHDCCSGNICLNGLCEIDDGEGYCANYGPACASGDCNASGACTCLGDGAQTTNPLDCCSANLADDGVCTSNTTLDQPCADASDCNAFQICDPDGGPTPDTLTCKLTSFGSAVEPCLTREDCASWPVPLTCQNWGKCCNQPPDPCLSDTDCCVGSVCDSWPQPGLGACKGHNGNPCTSDDDCLFGCNNGGCN